MALGPTVPGADGRASVTGAPPMRMGLLGLLLFAAGAVAAEPAITVLGLFKDKAVVTIDGQRRVLTRGQASPEGVTLVSADSEAAVLSYRGHRRTYHLGSEPGGRYREPQVPEVRIPRGGDGMYHTAGDINGRPVSFLVDTGATTIAMNAGQARALGLDYEQGRPAMVTTASGQVPGYQLELNRVQVGPIGLREVAAVVVEGDYPERILLGLSFLERVEIQRRGKILYLRKPY